MSEQIDLRAIGDRLAILAEQQAVAGTINAADALAAVTAWQHARLRMAGAPLKPEKDTLIKNRQYEAVAKPASNRR